jgi:hypothetical protein
LSKTKNQVKNKTAAISVNLNWHVPLQMNGRDLSEKAALLRGLPGKQVQTAPTRMLYPQQLAPPRSGKPARRSGFDRSAARLGG